MQRDLADRARRGDHDAFDVLAAASIGRLYSIAGALPVHEVPGVHGPPRNVHG